MGPAVLALLMFAQAPAQQSAINANLCTTTVQIQPPAGRGAQGAGQAGRGGGGQGGAGRAGQAPAPPQASELPKLVKIRDDVYVIQNLEDTVAQIGPFGGNVTIYLTNDGVILVDSKRRQHA